MQLLPTPTQAVIVATQAIVAAIIEERFVLTADETGFRDRKGNFVTKRRAYAQSALGVGAIAIGVLLVPYIADTVFVSPLVQTFGIGLVAAVGLVHQIARRWTLGVEDYVAFVLGVSLLFGPFGVTGAIIIGVIMSLSIIIEHYDIRDKFSVEDAKKGIDAAKQKPQAVPTIIIVVVLREQSPYQAVDEVTAPQTRERDTQSVEEE